VDVNYGGVSRRQESSMLTEKAAKYLAGGPADVVDLIGHVCNLPGAPRIVAEHMARAIFSGRPEFLMDEGGRWSLMPGNNAALTAHAATATNLGSLSFVVVDVETTGGQFPSHRITEFAAVVVRNGQIVDKFETLVNPERPIPPFVTRLTRITWDMVKNKPTFAGIAPRVLDVLEGNVFVAHNATFDWNFVSDEVRRATGAELVGSRLCTVKLARQLLPHLPKRSLDYVANHYGVEIAARHRAGGDAMATAHCLIRLLDDAAQRGCTTLSDLDRLTRKRKAKKRKRRSALPSPVDKDTTA
jgi:DNA polymerase-3 subunit epsilon